MGKYDDIINLSRPVSKRPKMTLEQRSAQFAPFAALTGYEGQVKETARLTSKKIEIDDELKSILDNKLQIIEDNLDKVPLISIKYFIPDLKKEGGFYQRITGKVTKIDKYKKLIIVDKKIEKSILDIIEITGDIFNKL